MKKLFTLVAMAFMAIGANAQGVIAEIDWTQEAAYYEGVWYSDLAEVSVDGGLVINCTQPSPETANYWEPQVPMIAHIYQCGKIPGKHVIKNVQVIDLEEGGEPGPALLSEIDWTKEAAYYEGVWYSDLAEVSVTEGEGLIINCTQPNPDTANYWEPQVPMIAHIPELAEGGQYQVQFAVNAPAAGEIRLDFCSWTEGAKTTQDWVGTVEAGDNELTVDFLDYPGATTDAMIFYQCGKIECPGEGYRPRGS